MDARTLTRPQARARRGFTLVEMLTVVVIIGILASLVTGVAWQVKKSAGITVIKVEITNLEQALDKFKSQYGEYPPDMTDNAAVTRFVARAWPRYTGNWTTDIPNVAQLQGDPAAALVFWLGGLHAANSKQLYGFSKNPRNPFAAPANDAEGRDGPFFDFKADQLEYSGNKLYYYQPNKSADTEPYVYFRARADKTYNTSAAWNNCKPCRDRRLDPNATDLSQVPFANNAKFQIRAPGRDGKHGSDTIIGADSYGDEHSYDDIANFTDSTFEKAMP